MGITRSFKSLSFRSKSASIRLYPRLDTITPSALTTQDLQEEWTSEVLKKRQEMLLGVLKETCGFNRRDRYRAIRVNVSLPEAGLVPSTVIDQSIAFIEKTELTA